MKKRMITVYLLACCLAVAHAQETGVLFRSPDTLLQFAFDRVKKMALHYRGHPGDAVGPWYESALPPRYAFCMRDVSHQSIGGEILGLSAENKNMFTLFARHISESKDWCSYWEINRSGKPAPEDYRSDTAFWYNLNANFDLLNACWNLYLWTGDTTYINAPLFRYFHEKTVTDYITRWVLQPDSLLLRPAYPNAPRPFNEADAFHRCRGLPSYSEGVPGIKMGIDLVAAIYRGLLAYSDMLRVNGRVNEAAAYARKALLYQQHIDRYWWDDREQTYYTYYSNTGRFGKTEGETFLLWFNALSDSLRKQRTIAHLLGHDWNIENQSYFPVILYNNGYWKEGLQYLLRLASPATPRHEYPEASFGAVEAFVQGLMGVQADAREHRVTTLYRPAGEKISPAELDSLPVLQTLLRIRHVSKQQSLLENRGSKAIVWRAAFEGSFRLLRVNGKTVPAQTTLLGERVVSFAETRVLPGQTVRVQVK